MKKIFSILIICLLLGAALVHSGAPATATPTPQRNDPPPPVPLHGLLSAAAEGNLLVNGNMETLPFYWMPPNHYIAGGWNRWWIHRTVLPEFDDTRIARPHYEGDHAQVYFKWFGYGEEYHAGIYQVVEGLIPCTPYRFTMWSRNHSLDGTLPHARIGLDTQGTEITSGPSEGAVIQLPKSIVWSHEQTQLFAWEELAVEAEPTGSRLAAITYAHPEVPPGHYDYYADTFWDAGRLEQTTFSDGKLPASASITSTAFITGVTSYTVLDSLVIEWDVAAPAPTQVWYTIVPRTPPSTSTLQLSHQLFLPFVTAPFVERPLDRMTHVQISHDTHKEAQILRLKDGDTVIGIIRARRPAGDMCINDSSTYFQVTVSVPEVWHLYLPFTTR